MAKTKDEQDVIARDEKQLVEAGVPVPVLFGNETYISDHKPRAGTKHTQEEWLVEATEIKTVLERGDAVSQQTVEMLFLDAYDVIAAFEPPAARGKKKEKDDDDDQNKRERG